MELPPETSLQARHLRNRWLIIGAALVGLTLCVCVIGVALAPLAWSRLAGRARTLTSVVVCPQAKASDAVPRDTTGQFTIQPVYSEALTYAQDASAHASSQRVHYWSVDVLGQFPPMADIFTEAVGGVDQWNASLSTIDPAAYRCIVQDMQAAHLETQALTDLQLAAKEIPGPTTTAYLVPWNTNVFYGASGEQSLLIPFWEQNPLDRTMPRNGAADWFYLPGALDHEYLEVARYQKLGGKDNTYQTLLGNIVTDGLADGFAMRMTHQTYDWGISPDEEAALWARFQPDLSRIANANQRAQMIGDAAQNIPNSAGYAIGDHIVADYLQRHPDVTFNQLAGMDAQTILDGSGYNG